MAGDEGGVPAWLLPACTPLACWAHLPPCTAPCTARALYCSPGDTLHEVLDKIVGNRLHRVYVCGEGLVPCGVVTLTDILHILVGGSGTQH